MLDLRKGRWVVRLAEGEAEAVRAGELLVEHDVLPDVLYTSLLRRAISTAQIALDRADRHWIPVVRDWRLNERHYGALQGLNKAETAREYGEAQVHTWRRSYDIPPPAMQPGDPRSERGDRMFATMVARSCAAIRDLGTLSLL